MINLKKKQYTTAIYVRLGLLIYVSTYAALYISKLNIVSSSIQSGGGSMGSSTIDPQLSMPQMNELKSHFEQFKIGIPTF